MNRMFLVLFGTVFLFIINSCATNGPLFKPDQSSRQEYINTHVNISPGIKQAILKRQVVNGMTKEDVRASWGDPVDIYYYPKEVQISKGNYEFWYYKGTLLQTLAPNCTVTFKDDIVEEVYCGGWLEK